MAEAEIKDDFVERRSAQVEADYTQKAWEAGRNIAGMLFSLLNRGQGYRITIEPADRGTAELTLKRPPEEKSGE